MLMAVWTYANVSGETRLSQIFMYGSISSPIGNNPIVVLRPIALAGQSLLSSGLSARWL